MQILYGRWSSTQADEIRLHKKLGTVCSPSTTSQSTEVYFLDTPTPLDLKQEQRLRALLRSELSPTPKDNCLDLYVVPRQGTVSSWSSKASDILHICGFDEVLRIERGRLWRITPSNDISKDSEAQIAEWIHDRMMEEVLSELPSADFVFSHCDARDLKTFKVEGDTLDKLKTLNHRYGFAMSDEEIAVLSNYCQQQHSDVSDAELMMFAQVNSEHCRHKLFNAEWVVDGEQQQNSLFDMIRHTSECSPRGILSAYSDNAAVLEGHATKLFGADPHSREYRFAEQAQAISIKVETHNHPTAIAPAPGAATGSGGEIRDESATGRGGRPKAGLTGFCVSNFANQAPAYTIKNPPSAIATPEQIMVEAPIGAASFNNEFGRPAVCGYFRTFSGNRDGIDYGYCKPIMLAGGLGSIAACYATKQHFVAGTPLIVLGGPAMLIGLGGGAASSLSGGSFDESLDFASVQRDNAEMQRRCQEVINHCTADSEGNPIVSIHDVGAGGLSNAFPELVHDAGLGAVFDFDKIPRADSSLSPMELWCNESQERYVAAVDPQHLERFFAYCERERCPVAVVGHATEEQRIVLRSGACKSSDERSAIEMPMEALFGHLPLTQQDVVSAPEPGSDENVLRGIELKSAARAVLTFPTVASKSFLITIGDRSVGGLVSRDQMVGPWQVPVSDVAVTAAGYTDYQGEAMAVGERPPVALDSPRASARLAVAEAVLNILAADIANLSDIKLSANWMVAAKAPQQAKALFDAVQAVAKKLCPALGIAIPVGKDSVSMQMSWDNRQVISPLSLVVSAFAPVSDIRKTLTPQLQPCVEGNCLYFIDLSTPGNKLGASCLLQAHGSNASDGIPDLSDPEHLKDFATLLNVLRKQDKVLAYHDRSDGGLFACLVEMAFAGHCGIHCVLDYDEQELLRFMFSEGPGVVLQVTEEGAQAIEEFVVDSSLKDRCSSIGTAITDPTWLVEYRSKEWSEDTAIFHKEWMSVSQDIRCLRDNSQSATLESEASADYQDPGLSVRFGTKFSTDKPVLPRKLKVAILRDQGVNGHVEMAAAFDRAGFVSHDVQMSDLIAGETDINGFDSLAVCGGFSYGDVLGAGVGWAHSILLNDKLRDMFQKFFANQNTLTLGVCNGCQMLSQLKDIIPGAQHWPRFEDNVSGVFESRFVQVSVSQSPSVFLQGMEDSLIPIIVAHGEGRAVFDDDTDYDKTKGLTCMRYTDHYGKQDPQYPYNPNGSRDGATGFCNEDGRVTIMMPHPERCFRTVQCPWHPPEWKEDGAWMQLFYNATRFYRK